jgi:preprotein translocase subunit SecG
VQGMGRSFMHACLAVLFIIVVVLICTFVLDKRKEETGIIVIKRE